MTRNKDSWKKTWILPELRAKKGRRPLKASLSRAGKIELISKSWPSELSVGQVLVKYQPSGGEVSAGCRPTCLSLHVHRHSADTQPTYRRSVGWYIGRVSVAISADSIDRHSVDRCLKYTWSMEFELFYYYWRLWLHVYKHYIKLVLNQG